MSEPYRILITGSRKWRDETTIREAIAAQFVPADGRPIVVVHGACAGADQIAARIVEHFGSPYLTAEAHPADWSVGKKAGPERNQRMVDLGADVCLAFPFWSSRGTYDCMERAKAARIPVVMFAQDGHGWDQA